MKKKFVLVLALVLLVATAAFAGDVKFSGRVRQGYTFTFQEGKDASAAQQRAHEGKLAISVADADGLWSLAYGDVKGDLDTDDVLAASASISFSKALAKAGVDMKDWSVDFTIGNNVNDTQLNSYLDKTSKHWQRIQTAGTMVSTATVGYGSIVKAKVAADPTTATKTIVASATVAPIDGLKVSFGYGHNAKVVAEGAVRKNAIAADVAVDVAKMTKKDNFKLAVGVADTYGFKEENSGVTTEGKNNLAVTVFGGVEKVDGYVEYARIDATNYMKVLANFYLVKDMGLDAYFVKADFSKDPFSIGADVSYKFGGVSYSLNGEFSKVFKATGSTDTVNKFTITPAVAITF